MATKAKEPRVATVSFSVTGEFITEHCRNLWHEGAFKKAFDVLDCMIGMRRDQQIDVIEGRKKLIGVNDVDFVDDDWTPPEGYPTFLSMIEKAGTFDADELASRRNDDAREYLREVAILTYPGRWSDGELMMKVEGLTRKAEQLIGKTAAEAMLHELRDEIEPGVDFDPDEEIGMQWKSRMLTGTTPERREHEDRRRDGNDPIAKLYANAAGQMQMFAMMSGGDPLAVPSVDALMNRGMNIVPKLDPKMSSDSGWLLPDGKYYGCEAHEHIGLATNLLEKTLPKAAHGLNATEYERLAENRGWVKISKSMSGLHIVCQSNVTQKQRDRLFDYCELRGLDYKTACRLIREDS